MPPPFGRSCPLVQYERHLRVHVVDALRGSSFSVTRGINASADSFYSSQGEHLAATRACASRVCRQCVHPRVDCTRDSAPRAGRPSASFDDFNDGVVDVVERCTGAITLEMETYQLLDLARSARAASPIAASGAAIVVWNRRSGEALDKDSIEALESAGGRAALETLVEWRLSLE